MIDNLRLCPQCNEGYMRPISKVVEEDSIIEFYECDNHNCKYKIAQTGTDQHGEQTDELTMCSKCNITFHTELEYLQHYDEKHKPERAD